MSVQVIALFLHSSFYTLISIIRKLNYFDRLGGRADWIRTSDLSPPRRIQWFFNFLYNNTKLLNYLLITDTCLIFLSHNCSQKITQNRANWRGNLHLFCTVDRVKNFLLNQFFISRKPITNNTISTITILVGSHG